MDFVPFEKLSKKKKKEINKSKRHSWGTIDPRTKIVKNKRKYNRKNKKDVDKSENM